MCCVSEYILTLEIFWLSILFLVVNIRMSEKPLRFEDDHI